MRGFITIFLLVAGISAQADSPATFGVPLAVPRDKVSKGPRVRATLRPSPVVSDPTVRRTQVGLTDQPALTGQPAEMALPPAPLDASLSTPVVGGQSLSLQAALYGAITSNPDLVALRNSNIASPESVEVARRFPTTLNPTLWTDIRPNTLAPDVTGHGYHAGQTFVYISLRQPLELGHQTTHRYEIAKAALTQQHWTVVQAELLAMVQTYRFFQTAAYRREKLRVAQDLAKFNDSLMQSLKKRLEANQILAADVALAEVENQATRQQIEVARQDYANALTDLRNQIGTPETAATAEPLGEFILPRNIPEVDDQALIQLALQSRPEIQVARAQVTGAQAAVKLAKGDRIPTPIVGPQLEKDQGGVLYYGFVLITPLPYVNNGTPLVRLREADHRRAMVALHQIEQRTITQVRSAVAKWNNANRLVAQTSGLTETLKDQEARLERLFQDNQADINKLLQARQRLIQLENAELDALWQATQAQADLMTALGAPSLIAALQESATNPAANPPAPTAPQPPPPPPSNPRTTTPPGRG